MAYPRNLIQDGERVALDLRPHWWYFSRNILTGIPLAVILIVVLNADADWISKYGGILVGLVAIGWAIWHSFSSCPAPLSLERMMLSWSVLDQPSRRTKCLFARSATPTHSMS